MEIRVGLSSGRWLPHRVLCGYKTAATQTLNDSRHAGERFRNVHDLGKISEKEKPNWAL